VPGKIVDARICAAVGVAIDKAGALLVADDVGNTIRRVAPGGVKSARR
jgi:hypothetical protein